MPVKPGLVPYVGTQLTVSLVNMSLTGTLKEVEDDYIVVETQAEGHTESVLIFLQHIVALKLQNAAAS